MKNGHGGRFGNLWLVLCGTGTLFRSSRQPARMRAETGQSSGEQTADNCDSMEPSSAEHGHEVEPVPAETKLPRFNGAVLS